MKSSNSENTGAGANNLTQESLAAVKNSLFMAIDQNREFTQKLSRAMRDVSLEFMNTRLEHAGRAIERSRDWQGMSEMLVLQHEWMMDFARDYAELTKRVTEMLHDLPKAATNGDGLERDNGIAHRRTDERHVDDRVAA